MRIIMRKLLSSESFCKNLREIKCFFRTENGVKLIRRTCSTQSAIEDDEKNKKSSEEIEDLLENAAMGEGPCDAVDESDEWHTSPYPAGSTVNWKQSQARKSLRPRVDPSETSIILFPGQGSQFVGMGKSLLKFPKARDIFEAANEILKFDLLNLMLCGPSKVLNKTVYCQPAIYVCSLAAIEKLKEENPMAIESCMATAGFSVGELTALTFAGVFSFDTGLKLVKVRAEAMQLASEMVDSGMAMVTYGPQSELNYACLKAKEWCENRGIERPECRVAIYVGPHTKVVAGNTEALNFLQNNLAQFKLRRIQPVNVSGAFHTSIMKPAVEPFRKALQCCSMLEPVTMVYSNVTGKRYFDRKHIERTLPDQICCPVLWEQIMHGLYSRSKDVTFPRTYTCGPSNTLRSFLKLNNAKAVTQCTMVH